MKSNRWRGFLQSVRPLRYALIIAALFILPYVMMRTGKARTADRILAAYRAAEMAIANDDGSEKAMRQFVDNLKGIDQGGAPMDVRRALNKMIDAAEASSRARSSQGDTNKADTDLAFAKRELINEIGRWRGQPF